MYYYFRAFTIFLFASGILAIHTSGLVASVYSQTIPLFTSCTNPQGSIRADYSSGTHGIAGESTAYSGKDTVYTLSGNTVTQCFCSIKGDGIQTNWWKVSSLTATEISILEREGWIRIPNGTLWGLDDAPYLAKNNSYACGDRVGGVSDSNSESVLGLAATGNITLLLSLLFGGCLFLCIALLLRRRQDTAHQ